MFKNRSIGMRISIYTGGLLLILCVGLGILAYTRGSAAVLAERSGSGHGSEKAGEYVESRFETHLASWRLWPRPEFQNMDWEAQRLTSKGEGAAAAPRLLPSSMRGTAVSMALLPILHRDYVRRLCGEKDYLRLDFKSSHQFQC